MDDHGALVAKLDIGHASCSYKPNVRISEKIVCLCREQPSSVLVITAVTFTACYWLKCAFIG